MTFARIATLIAITSLPLYSQASTTPFQQEILNTHNEFRAKHNAPNLQWDEKLAEYAERHANQCKFSHSQGPFGENLAAGYATPAQGITVWYNENQLYSYADPKFTSDTGHFTQVVWKSTRKVGCAFVSCNGRHGTPGGYLVCEYSPAGNITNPGYFAENVTPPTSREAKA